MATSITPAVRRGGHGGTLLAAGADAAGVAVGAALALVVLAALAAAGGAVGGRRLWVGAGGLVVGAALASVGTPADEGPFGGRSAWGDRLRLLKLANAVAAATVITTALHEGGVF